MAIKFIIKKRRLSYLHITRKDNELIKKVYRAQKSGDWTITVNKDMDEINLNLSEEEIKGMKKERFKDCLKQKIIVASFKHLNKIKASYSKVQEVVY